MLRDLYLLSAKSESYPMGDERSVPGPWHTEGRIEGEAGGAFLSALNGWLKTNGLRMPYGVLPDHSPMAVVSFQISYQIKYLGPPPFRKASAAEEDFAGDPEPASSQGTSAAPPGGSRRGGEAPRRVSTTTEPAGRLVALDALRARVLATADRRIEDCAADVFYSGPYHDAKYTQLARIVLCEMRADLAAVFDECGAT